MEIIIFKRATQEGKKKQNIGFVNSTIIYSSLEHVFIAMDSDARHAIIVVCVKCLIKRIKKMRRMHS